jgi:hypothetical protein
MAISSSVLFSNATFCVPSCIIHQMYNTHTMKLYHKEEITSCRAAQLTLSFICRDAWPGICVLSEFSGSHGGEYEDGYLLGCFTV